jgi:Ca2+-binding RTX toxin-like protein
MSNSTVSIITSTSLFEGDDGTKVVSFLVARTDDNTAFTVEYATTDGTATGEDYLGASGVLTFTAGGPSQYTIEVQIVGDSIVEENETFVLTLSNLVNTVGITTIGESTGVITIIDDDFPTLSINDPRVTEGDSGSTILTYTVTANQAPLSPITFDIATADGTATAGSDYVARSLLGQTIPAGTTTYTFDVVVNGDTDVETSETVLVNLSNVSHASVAKAQGIGTIVRDDSPPILSISDPTVTEGDAGTTVLTYTVTTSSLSPLPISFDIATGGGTGTPGSDYEAKALTEQMIPAGSLTYTFDVIVNGDTDIEPDETVLVSLSNVTNATASKSQGLGTITNDDFGSSTVSISDASASEGAATVTFFVTRTDPNTAFTVVVSTANGSASAFQDYEPTVGALTFTAGGPLQQIITINLLDDNLAEPTEAFTFNLADVFNEIGTTVIKDGSGTCTLFDDDVALAGVSIADASIAEGDNGTKVLSFTVTRTSTETAFTVDYTTQEATATAGSDYIAKGGTLTFAAGGPASQTISITVNGDTALETDETFAVNLLNLVDPTSSTIILDGSAIGTIVNDDVAENQEPVFTSPSSFVVSENHTIVGSITAVDPEQDAISFALAGGADQSFFGIDAQTGVLSFVTGPDFESPEDANKDNVYDLIVSAIDAQGAISQQTVHVGVANLDEGGIVINGGDRNDTLTGTSGNDVISGGGGNDFISAGDGNDMVSGGKGNDNLDGGRGDNAIDGNDGNDVIRASDGNNVISGGAGNDKIAVGNGHNVVDGGEGNDLIAVGGGINVLSGGSGSDTFSFGESTGRATITDFDANPTGGQDLLDISALGITAANFAARVAIIDLGADIKVTIDGSDMLFLLGLSGSGANVITQQDFLLSL